MHKLMLIDALHPEEMRMVITDAKSTIHEFDFTSAAKQQLKSNIYLAKVTRVEPSLQAAFVEYGGGKQGFLPFAEIHPDYYQIPVADRARLMEEALAEEDTEGEEAETGSERGERGDRRDRRDRRRRGRGRDRDRRRDGQPQPQDGAASEVSAEITESAEGYALVLNEEPVAEAAEASDSDSRISESAGLHLPESVISEKTEEELQALSANDDVVVEAEVETSTEPKTEEAQDEGVETLSSEEEIERPRRRNFFRRYKIQEVIKRGQVMLVQVIKEERGNKGVSLTTYLSLAGRYCVLMPNSPRGGGVSRKIGTGEDRKRLKSILDDLELPGAMSVIIRTAGANRTKVEVKRDFEYLVKLWNQIREDTFSSTAPALIYQESDLIKRSIRDVYSNEIEEILIEGETAYKEARHFMKMLVPSHTPRVKLYRGQIPLFAQYNVEEPLLSMHDPVVKLRSGGYIVMNPTEALISIDVNSGRSTGERNVEETAVKTNLEAAQEIARQLRLRDLAGLIVIDFIDMMEGRNRRNVERVLKDALRSDRAKIQIGRISPFGLLEMSRQRLRPSIAESVTKPCDHCSGTGLVKSDAAVAMQLVRSIEKEAGQNASIERFKLFITPNVAVYMLNHLRETLQKLEHDYAVTLEMQIDPALRDGNFRLDKIRNKDRERSRPHDLRRPVTMEATEEELEAVAALEAEIAAEEAQNQAESAEGREGKGNQPRRRDRNRRRGRDRQRENPAGDVAETEVAATSEAEPITGEVEGETPQKQERRPRGRHPRKTPPREKAKAEASAAVAVEAVTVPVPELLPVAPVSVISPPPPSKPVAVPELAVLAEPKPQKPVRKGWWQKIME